MKREIAITMTAAFAGLTLSTAAMAEQTVNRTLPARPDVAIHVENIAGEVSVDVGNDNEIRLQAVLGDDVEQLEIEGDPSGYSFEVKIADEDHWFDRRPDVAATIELWVPAGAEMEIESVSAGVNVRGIKGGVEVESVSGRVQLDDVAGGVEVEAVSGQVTVRAAGGPVWVESVSGQIEVSGASGEAGVESVSGSVTVSGFNGHEVDLETVSGAIDFDGAINSPGELCVATVSGQVTLALPADLRADFEIETFSGSIRSDFGGTVQKTSKYAPGKYLSHKGGDDVEVCVETMSGGVSIIKR